MQHPTASGTSSRSFHSTEDPKQYRAFVFCIHDTYGALLLHCTRKQPVKPPHFQIPGGHVDAADHDSTTGERSLQQAGQVCAARELQEETGLRVDPGRLQPLQLYNAEMGERLVNEYKHRLFYRVRLTDDDFPTEGGVSSMENAGTFAHIKLHLSEEHSGFTFRPVDALGHLLEHHSGGKVAEAWRMAWHVNREQFRWRSED